MNSSLQTRPAALLFDIDGTLVDTMPIHFRAWTASMAEAGMNFVPWEEFVDLGGTSASDLVARLASEQGIEPDRDAVLTAKMNRVLSTIPETQAIPAAVRLAQDYLDQGGRVALVTGGRRDAVTQSLAHNGLEYLAQDVLITPAELQPGRGKPHPDGLLLACQQLGVDPTACLYVGDSPLDRGAAEAAGMVFLHVDELGDGSAPWA